MSAATTIVIPAMSIGLAFYALVHQRKLAEDERIWQRRADLYVDLLLNEQGYVNPDPGLVEILGPSTTQRMAIRGLTARADAFASDRVVQLWHDSCRRISDLSFAAGEIAAPDGSYTPQQEAELAPLAAAQIAAATALRAQIRRELKTRPLRRLTRKP
jgi:hypothetical protein